MSVRETGGLHAGSRYDAAAAAETLAELEAQRASGGIEIHAYLEKKAALVRLFVQATTAPRPAREEDYGGEVSRRRESGAD